MLHADGLERCVNKVVVVLDRPLWSICIVEQAKGPTVVSSLDRVVGAGRVPEAKLLTRADFVEIRTIEQVSRLADLCIEGCTLHDRV